MLEFHPLSADRWDDLVRLFEHHGSPGYCWCTFWRLPASEYSRSSSTGRRQFMQERVASGTPTGILAYRDGVPIGWCSVAPRPSYGRLQRSEQFPSLDERDTWSVVCIYLDRAARGQKFSLDLLRAAVDYAASQGAEVVEGYPVEPKVDAQGKLSYEVSYRFMGFVSTFEKAGFKDMTPHDSQRRIMRFEVSTSYR
jgi:GNAT superfamily N-acetyltransferase